MSEPPESTSDAEPESADLDAPSPSDAADSEAPKKKKKKKAKAEVAEISDPRALEIATAFDAGNFARVRELGEALTKTDDAALAAVGRDYLARIAVDPVQIAFLGLCAAALLTIAWIYIPH